MPAEIKFEHVRILIFKYLDELFSMRDFHHLISEIPCIANSRYLSS